MADLLILARHGEFALYTSHALLRESEAHPELKRHLVALLPISYQWGVIKLVEYIVRDESLIRQKAVQRDVLIYGMQNCQGIPMEVALTPSPRPSTWLPSAWKPLATILSTVRWLH